MRFLLLVCSFAVSCSPSKSRKNSVEDVQTQPWSVGGVFADEYALADSACQEGSGRVNITDAQLYRYQGSGVETLVLPSETYSDQSLAGDGIFGTRFGFHQRSKCTDGPNGAQCGEAEVVAPSRNLRICQSEAKFARASVEAVALTSQSHIGAARKFYLKTSGSKQDIKQARLLVLPLVEEEVQRGATKTSYFKSDNLAYAANYGNEPTFIIFPKSQAAEKRGLWKNMNFWEVPWALAHEYGHHVFRTHAPVLAELQSLNPIHSFEADASKPKSPESALGLLAANDIWGATNEGFADIFAHYALGNSSVRGFDCFAVNRDVTSARFANGRTKVLDAEVLRLFGTTGTSPGDCNTPNFRDIHHVGAIIAYGVDQIFAEAYGDSKAGPLLQWVNDLAANRAGITDFNGIVNLAIKNGRGCAAARRVFPALTLANCR
jgi:hypothetical protein